MGNFWHGFKSAKRIPAYKKHVIVLFWNPSSDATLKDRFTELRFKYPSVKVKVVDICKDPLHGERFGVKKSPAIILLKEGREVDRVGERDGGTLTELLFNKALV